jgi:hypothetical protein
LKSVAIRGRKSFRERVDCYVSVRTFKSFPAKSAQKRRKPNGMVVAQSTAIAFVPTKTWWRG